METAKENISDLQKELRIGAIGGFWDQFSRFGTPLQDELYQIRQAFNQGKLSAQEYSEALFKLATKYPDFGEQAEDVQQQVLALLAAERAAKKAAAALDELRNPKPQQEQEKPAEEAPKPYVRGFTEDDKKRVQERITELQAEEQALRRLTAARAEGEESVRRAMITNEQEQTLRRAGIDITAAKGTAEGDYAERIKALVSEIYTLQETEKRHQESQRESQKTEREREKTVEDVRKRYEDLNKTLEGAIARAEKWRNEAMRGLNETAAGYEEFSKQVEAVYQDMLREAREEDLRSSKRWEDGIKRGLKSVTDDAQDMASKAERGVTSMFKNMEDALVNFVQTGKLNFGDFANSIIADLIRMQIQSSITTPLAGALNTFIGGLFGGGSGTAATPTAHTGGVIGHDSLGSKSVHPSIFHGAPRFHTGGVVGDEVPIIAKKGEAVFTPGQMRLLGGSLQNKPSVNVSVKVENKVAGAEASATVRRDNSGNLDLSIVIEEVETKMARNIGRGEGLAGTLERRYGLNPAAGSYR